MATEVTASRKWLRAMAKGNTNTALFVACIDIVLMLVTFNWQPDGYQFTGMCILLVSFYCCVVAAVLAYLQANSMGGSWIKSL